MTNTWILAADGNSARLLKGVNFLKDGSSSPEQEIFETDTKQVQDIMADKPGRGHTAGSPGRSAMEYSSDPVRVEQERFASHLAETLEGYANDDAFDRLIVCAAPQTLGDLRSMLGAKSKERTMAEVNKNFTNLPTDKLIANVRSAVFNA